MSKPPVVPRPASTLILVRDSQAGMEVFMMQRTHAASFVPGGYVFPGGALDAADTDPFFAEAGGLDDIHASRLLGLQQGGLSYWVAAVRECFEEAGYLLAKDTSGQMVRFTGTSIEASLSALRTQVAASETSFSQFCQTHQLKPAFEEMVYFAHWITPVGVPRRFDTRFFLAVAPEGQIPSHDNGEMIGFAWLRPADVLARHRAGEIELMFATVRTLENLGRFENTAALMEHARAVQSVPMNQPRVTTAGGKRRVLLQGDAGYAEAVKLDPEGTASPSSEIVPGVVTRLSATVTRIAAPNPGFMTGPGTNSYLVGNDDELAIIDPGPAIAEHVERLLEQANGRIRWVLTTHTHTDHSPAALLIKERTGARLAGLPPPDAERQDQTYRPDVILQDGEHIRVGGCTLRAIHTPGHASNHLCYLLEEERLLFTGDHIMQGSTVVINPPDGNMTAYLASLRKLDSFDVAYLAPGHGFLLDRPAAVYERIAAHRLAREKKVLAVLERLGQGTLSELVALAYDDVAEQRHAMAARSLLAHLEKLRSEGRAIEHAGQWKLQYSAGN